MNLGVENQLLDQLHELLLAFAPRDTIKPGLERIEALCQTLQHPERRFPSVHIAGSNGKGSVAALLAGALRASGLRVGLYTSPHLHRWSERICVDGVEIPLKRLLALVERLASTAKTVEATVFELITAVAFEHFSQQQVDLAIVETGLGGRFDATNVVQPLVTVLTAIDLDHTDMLGDTLEEIAWEKAGIIKPGVPVVCAPLSEEVQRVVDEACRLNDAERYVACPLTLIDMGRSLQTVEAPVWGRISTTLLGPHQVSNLSTAVATLNLLREKFDLDRKKLKAGLENTRWPGRFEVMNHKPFVVLDGAHNPQGIRMLLETLKSHPAIKEMNGKRWLLFGTRADKDYEQMTKTLFPWFDRIGLAPLTGMRGLDPAALHPYAQTYDPDAQVHSSAIQAINGILQRLEADDMLCVSGSLFLVGEVRWQLLEAGN